MTTKEEHQRLSRVCEHVDAIVELLTEPQPIEAEAHDWTTQVLVSLATTLVLVAQQYREKLPGEH